MLGRLATFSVDHRGWVAGGILALAIAAAVYGAQVKLDALPDLTNNQVIVLTRAPGLTPEEVERLVTIPIEVALGGVPGLVEHRSLSRYGISSVTVVFDDAMSPWLARQVISERLMSVTLPEAVERPELAPLTGGLGEIFHITLSSSRRTPAELLELATVRVGPLLKSVAGVVEVNSWGGAQRTLDVMADSSKLAARALTLDELKQSLESASGSRAAGALPAQQGQVLVRAVARPIGASELGAAVVASHGTIRVADVGEVVEGAQLRLGAATSNGRGETLYLMVQMLRDQNALDVMAAIHRSMTPLRAALPEDVVVDVVYDRSTLVMGTLRTVGKNLLEGALLVMIVLLAFLGSWRAGLVVASLVPLSMAFALAAMTLLDIPGNLMSLGALDFGLLVDGAIVMIEGIFHGVRHDRGSAADMRHRVRRVVARNARPVFFSVLVIVLVYVPVLSLTGVDGKMFRPMALTVVFALTAALILALTWVPAMASLVLREQDVPAKDPLAVRVIERVYRVVLRAALNHRAAVAFGGLAVLLAGTMAAFTRGVEFTPQLDEGDMVIQTTRRPDISLEASVAESLRLEAVIQSSQFPEVLRVVSRVGSPAVATDIMGLEQADVFVKLKPREQWRPGLSREQLVSQMQKALEREAPGAEPSFTQPIQMRFNELLGGAVTDVAVSVYGADLVELRSVSTAIAREIEQVTGATDVRVLAPPAVPLATVRPRPLEASQVGFAARDVLDAVQAVRVGIPVGDTWEGQLRVPIRLRLSGAGDAWSLPALQLPVASGGVVSLSRIADVENEDAPGLVNRRNGQRRLQVGFNVRGADLGSVVRAAQARVDRAVVLPTGYRLEWGGQFESLNHALARLAIVVPVVLALIILTLSITFARLRPALVIFSVVPFGVAGGMLALTAFGLPVSLSAAIGFIALSGIAVMNGVVWVSGALELEVAGVAPREAGERTAIERLRPVVMTAVVAALGFVPMVLAQGPGAEVQRPLATVVVGGLAFSSAPVLLVLPALWPWLNRRRKQRLLLPSTP